MESLFNIHDGALRRLVGRRDGVPEIGDDQRATEQGRGLGRAVDGAGEGRRGRGRIGGHPAEPEAERGEEALRPRGVPRRLRGEDLLEPHGTGGLGRGL